MWQTVNEASKKKGTTRAKLKAASQEELRVKKTLQKPSWKLPESYDEPITKIINNQLRPQTRRVYARET